jgi:HSP20 family protein
MTVYIRTPYGRFPRPHMHRFGHWPFESGEVFFPIDVKTEKDDFIIQALLPGLKAEDVSIEITDNDVTLRGEFKQIVDEKDEYIMQEIPGGKFDRTIILPVALDASNASAEMKDGILTLKVTKAEEAKPKTIKVTAK